MTRTSSPAASRRPVVANTCAELAVALAEPRAAGDKVVLIPTMGALHAGHASLLETSRKLGDTVVVSIFVNPMQFGPNEDLDRYPRTLDADLEVCAGQGVDVVFAPSVGEVYPDGEPQVTVDPGPLATILEGQTRPTHFHGVLTVVAKLFGLVRPDVAVFGQKDYQQLVLIRRMVADLCMGLEVFGAETIREESGLALSSRNKYLDDNQLQLATVLFRSLCAGAGAGVHGADAAIAAARAVLLDTPGVELDYLALTSRDLGEAPETGQARLLVAAGVGRTRLIDNTELVLGTPAQTPIPRSS